MRSASRVTHDVVWHPSARNDLLEIYDWIETRADAAIALRYIKNVEACGNGLADYPARGTPRDHLSPALRTITYRKRAIITYKIVDREVHILRVVHAAQDIGAIFPEND